MKRKFPPVQKLRWFFLISIVLFFILVPLSNRYANYKNAYNNARLVELADGPLWGNIYQFFDWIYSHFQDPIRVATSNNGSMWAFTLFGIPLSDPIGVISQLLSAGQFPLTYFLGALIPLLVALLFGRIFCSWMCPMVPFYKISGWIRGGLQKINWPLLEFKIEKNTRIVVFFGGLFMAHLWGFWVWHFILPYITLSQEFFSLIVFSGFTTGIYFLLALFLLDIAVFPGQFCESVCPTGWFLSLFGKIQFFKIQTPKGKCPPKCLDCFHACPIKLYPPKEKLSGCHLCGLCIEACPPHIISVNNRLGFQKKPESPLLMPIQAKEISNG